MPNPKVLYPSPPAEASARAALEMLARLAASLVKAPAAVVGIPAPGGQWHNICAGLDSSWSRQTLPGAAEASAAEGLFTCDYPSGSHPAGSIRFFAALPLVDFPGFVGVMDSRPRTLTPDETGALENVRALVVDVLARGKSEASPGDDICFILDLEGHLTDVRGRFIKTGYSERDLLGADILDLVPEDQRNSARDRLLAQLGDGTSGSFDLPLRTKNGDPIWLKLRTRLLFEQGRPAGIEAFCRDITTTRDLEALRREAELKLFSKTEELARFSENLRELQRISVTPDVTLDALFRMYLASGCAMFSVPAGVISAENGDTLAQHPAGFAESFYPVLSAALHSGDTPGGQLAFGYAGPKHRAWSTLDRDLVELMAQSVGHAMRTHHLQRELADAAVHLEQQLRCDTLTGIANRLGLMEWLESALRDAGSRHGTVCLLYIDLDQFKAINDTLGHAAGDFLLREASHRLLRCCRTADFAARMGGDEFTFAIGGSPDHPRMVQRIHELLETLRAPYLINDCEIVLTASIGASVYPRDGTGVEALLQHADAAMFRAKSSGKNDYRFFAPDMAATALNRLELETQLRRAIDHDEFTIRFQPILSIGGVLVGLEVLLAWDSPKFGRVLPADFIPIAEETGLIVPIGRWVLHQACMQNVAWQKLGYGPLRISVNVSALQFARADIVDMVAEELRETGMQPEYLDLELTESIIMRDIEECLDRMDRLRRLGVSMSIDDFGTGYSSLNYLRRLPVDSLKIDKSFLSEMASSSSSLPLIQTIVVLAHNMGMSVVAEGVETEEQLAVLRAMGCDRVQGHLFGAPVPASAVPAILDKHRKT